MKRDSIAPGSNSIAVFHRRRSSHESSSQINPVVQSNQSQTTPYNKQNINMQIDQPCQSSSSLEAHFNRKLPQVDLRLLCQLEPTPWIQSSLVQQNEPAVNQPPISSQVISFKLPQDPRKSQIPLLARSAEDHLNEHVKTPLINSLNIRDNRSSNQQQKKVSTVLDDRTEKFTQQEVYSSKVRSSSDDSDHIYGGGRKDSNSKFPNFSDNNQQSNANGLDLNFFINSISQSLSLLEECKKIGKKVEKYKKNDDEEKKKHWKLKALETQDNYQKSFGNLTTAVKNYIQSSVDDTIQNHINTIISLAVTETVESNLLLITEKYEEEQRKLKDDLKRLERNNQKAEKAVSWFENDYQKKMNEFGKIKEKVSSIADRLLVFENGSMELVSQVGDQRIELQTMKEKLNIIDESLGAVDDNFNKLTDWMKLCEENLALMPKRLESLDEISKSFRSGNNGDLRSFNDRLLVFAGIMEDIHRKIQGLQATMGVPMNKKKAKKRKIIESDDE